MKNFKRVDKYQLWYVNKSTRLENNIDMIMVFKLSGKNSPSTELEYTEHPITAISLTLKFVTM